MAAFARYSRNPAINPRQTPTDREAGDLDGYPAGFQHIGAPAKANRFGCSDTVDMGQPIAETGGFVSAPVPSVQQNKGNQAPIPASERQQVLSAS